MSTTQQQLDRMIAHLNHDASVLTAHCEECGRAIPVELTRCEDCEADRESQNYADSRESFDVRCVW